MEKQNHVGENISCGNEKDVASGTKQFTVEIQSAIAHSTSSNLEQVSSIDSGRSNQGKLDAIDDEMSASGMLRNMALVAQNESDSTGDSIANKCDKKEANNLENGKSCLKMAAVFKSTTDTLSLQNSLFSPVMPPKQLSFGSVSVLPQTSSGRSELKRISLPCKLSCLCESNVKMPASNSDECASESRLMHGETAYSNSSPSSEGPCVPNEESTDVTPKISSFSACDSDILGEEVKTLDIKNVKTDELCSVNKLGAHDNIAKDQLKSKKYGSFDNVRLPESTPNWPPKSDSSGPRLCKVSLSVVKKQELPEVETGPVELLSVQESVGESVKVADYAKKLPDSEGNESVVFGPKKRCASPHVPSKEKAFGISELTPYQQSSIAETTKDSEGQQLLPSKEANAECGSVKSGTATMLQESDKELKDFSVPAAETPDKSTFLGPKGKIIKSLVEMQSTSDQSSDLVSASCDPDVLLDWEISKSMRPNNATSCWDVAVSQVPLITQKNPSSDGEAADLKERCLSGKCDDASRGHDCSKSQPVGDLGFKGDSCNESHPDSDVNVKEHGSKESEACGDDVSSKADGSKESQISDNVSRGYKESQPVGDMSNKYDGFKESQPADNVGIRDMSGRPQSEVNIEAVPSNLLDETLGFSKEIAVHDSQAELTNDQECVNSTRTSTVENIVSEHPGKDNKYLMDTLPSDENAKSPKNSSEDSAHDPGNCFGKGCNMSVVGDVEAKTAESKIEVVEDPPLSSLKVTPPPQNNAPEVNSPKKDESNNIPADENSFNDAAGKVQVSDAPKSDVTIQTDRDENFEKSGKPPVSGRSIMKAQWQEEVKQHSASSKNEQIVLIDDSDDDDDVIFVSEVKSPSKVHQTRSKFNNKRSSMVNKIDSAMTLERDATKRETSQNCEAKVTGIRSENETKTQNTLTTMTASSVWKPPVAIGSSSTEPIVIDDAEESHSAEKEEKARSQSTVACKSSSEQSKPLSDEASGECDSKLEQKVEEVNQSIQKTVNTSKPICAKTSGERVVIKVKSKRKSIPTRCDFSSKKPRIFLTQKQLRKLPPHILKPVFLENDSEDEDKLSPSTAVKDTARAQSSDDSTTSGDCEKEGVEDSFTSKMGSLTMPCNSEAKSTRKIISPKNAKVVSKQQKIGSNVNLENKTSGSSTYSGQDSEEYFVIKTNANARTSTSVGADKNSSSAEDSSLLPDKSSQNGQAADASAGAERDFSQDKDSSISPDEILENGQSRNNIHPCKFRVNHGHKMTPAAVKLSSFAQKNLSQGSGGPDVDAVRDIAKPVDSDIEETNDKINQVDTKEDQIPDAKDSLDHLAVHSSGKDGETGHAKATSVEQCTTSDDEPLSHLCATARKTSDACVHSNTSVSDTVNETNPTIPPSELEKNTTYIQEGPLKDRAANGCNSKGKDSTVVSDKRKSSITSPSKIESTPEKTVASKELSTLDPIAVSPPRKSPVGITKVSPMATSPSVVLKKLDTGNLVEKYGVALSPSESPKRCATMATKPRVSMRRRRARKISLSNENNGVAREQNETGDLSSEKNEKVGKKKLSKNPDVPVRKKRTRLLSDSSEEDCIAPDFNLKGVSPRLPVPNNSRRIALTNMKAKLLLQQRHRKPLNRNKDPEVLKDLIGMELSPKFSFIAKRKSLSSMKVNMLQKVIISPTNDAQLPCRRRSMDNELSPPRRQDTMSDVERDVTASDSSSGSPKIERNATFRYIPKLEDIVMPFDSMTTTCCFCRLPGNHLLGLGDLFGPYRPLAEEVLARQDSVNDHLKGLGTTTENMAHAAAGSPQVTFDGDEGTCFITARVEEDKITVDGITVKDITEAVARSSHRLRTLSTIDHILQDAGNLSWQNKQKVIDGGSSNPMLRIPGPENECKLISSDNRRQNASPRLKNGVLRPQKDTLLPNIKSIVFLEPKIELPHASGSEDMISPSHSPVTLGQRSPRTPGSASRRKSAKSSRSSGRLSQPISPSPETHTEVAADSTSVCISHKFNTGPLWTHGYCALWADGVFAIRGQLHGLWDASRTSSQITCFLCNRTGATIVTFEDKMEYKTRGVPLKAYHYPCALCANLKLNWENLTARR